MSAESELSRQDQVMSTLQKKTYVILWIFL